MPQYRVEVSPNNRAGCQDKQCKEDKVKLHKGELRFGTWVEIPSGSGGDTHASWKWKHWGCVSGLQLEHVRGLIERNGSYAFDGIDGYDELDEHPDVQAKIRRVITQGFIDPEDFKGDPEYNKLGSRGIRGTARKAKKVEDEDEDKAGDTEAATRVKKAAGGKRNRKAAKVDEEDNDVEAEPEPPKKKARQTKKAAVNAEAEDDTGVADDVPAPAAKTKRAKGAKAAKAAETDEPEAEPPRKKTAKAKKASAKAAPVEEEEQPEPEEDDAEVAPKIKRRGMGKAAAEKTNDKPAAPAKGRSKKSTTS